MRRLGVLVAGTIAVWALLALPATLLIGEPPVAVTAGAAGVCLIPAALTLALNDRVRERPPEEKIVIVLVSTFLRMGLAIGLGVLLYYVAPPIRDNVVAFVGWGVVFYLVTLGLETSLLYRDATRASQSS